MAAALMPDRGFQRGPLLGAAALLVFVVASVGVGRLAGLVGNDPVAPPGVPVLAERDLRFEDQPDGGILVTEAAGTTAGRPVAVLDPGTNGFVRGTLRSLARDRRREDAERAAPFRVARWADGRVTLQDRATGRTLDLDAFGRTNADAFARLLTAREARP